MKIEAGFVGEKTVLADRGAGAGATIRTSPACARPAPGATVLLTADGGATIATIAVVLVEAPACNEIVTVVSLQSETTPV